MEILHLLVHPKWLTQLVQGQAEARRLGHHSDLPPRYTKGLCSWALLDAGILVRTEAART